MSAITVGDLAAAESLRRLPGPDSGSRTCLARSGQNVRPGADPNMKREVLRRLPPQATAVRRLGPIGSASAAAVRLPRKRHLRCWYECESIASSLLVVRQ